MKDYFGYNNKICVVTGAASGIGKATAELLVELNAEVYALDITKQDIPGVKEFIEVDLSNKESIDEAMEHVPRHIDSFFGVAGLSGAKTNYYKTFTVNYIANKYMMFDNYIYMFHRYNFLACSDNKFFQTMYLLNYNNKKMCYIYYK